MIDVATNVDTRHSGVHKTGGHDMLSDTQIRKLKPQETRYSILDSDGLYIEILPTGKKYWRIRKRKPGGGGEIRRSIGAYPEIGLKEARQKRDDLVSTLPELGGKKNVNTFAELAHEWLEVKMYPTKAPRYIETLVYKIEKLLIPHIGHRQVDTLTAPELLEVLRKIESRGTVETARRTRQMCGQILRYGVATGRCDRDISADLKGALQTVRHRNMSTLTNPIQIGGLMRSIEEELKGQIRLTLLFQAYTFARPGEIRKAEWEEIEIDMWKIPAEKMKMKRTHWIPLSHQAIKVLEELRGISGDSRFLFPSIRSPKTPMSDMTVNAAIRRLGYTQEEMTGHGFRSMFSTIANEHGWPPDVIERQLAHVPKNAVRAAYNHAEYLPKRIELMQWWADWLDEQRG